MMILGTLLAGCLLTTAMPDEAAPPGLPRVDALVRAQVQEVRKDEQFNTSILRIEHIYSGQRDLIGRTFTAYTLTGSYLSGQSIDPQPTLGEVGIWSVRRVEDGITAVHPGGQGSFQWPSLFPARKGLHPRFEQAETLAEVIGAASRLPVAERPAFLRRHVTSEVSEVASWAVYALAEADPAAVDALVRGLASNDRITIGGQVALDDVLCGREQARWAASPERVRLLRTWVTGRRPEDDAQWIVPRLDLIAQHPLGLDRLVLLKVLQGAADNPGFPVEFRPRAIIAMGWLARDGDSEVIEAVFRTLVAYVRDAPEHQVQRQAAGVLTRVPLTRARSTLIRELWGRVDDAVIRDTLQEALGDAGRG